MANTEVFYCEVRKRTGTGGAREARREGWIPGILYGGDEDPVAINLRKNEVFNAAAKGALKSQMLKIDVPGQKELQSVLARDVQLDPVKDLPIHVDMMRISEKTRINIEVSVRFINEETSPGIKKGGVLNIVRHTVEVNAPATAIPEYLEFDISEADVGDSINISGTDLPNGVKPLITDRDFTVATIAAPSALRSSDSDDEGEAQTTDEEATQAEATEGGEKE